MSNSREVLCNNANQGVNSTAGNGVCQMSLNGEVFDLNLLDQHLTNSLTREVVPLVILADVSLTEVNGYMCLTISSKIRKTPKEQINYEKFLTDLSDARKSGDVSKIDFSKLPFRSYGGENRKVTLGYRFGEVATALGVDPTKFVEDLYCKLSGEIYTRINEVFLQSRIMRDVIDRGDIGDYRIVTDRIRTSSEITVTIQSRIKSTIIDFAYELSTSIHNNIDINALVCMVKNNINKCNIEGAIVPSYVSISRNAIRPLYPRFRLILKLEYPDIVFISHHESPVMNSLLYGRSYPVVSVEVSFPESSKSSYNGSVCNILGKNYSNNNARAFMLSTTSSLTVPHPIINPNNVIMLTPGDHYVACHTVDMIMNVLSGTMSVLPIFMFEYNSEIDNSTLSVVNHLSHFGKKMLVILQKLVSHPTKNDIIKYWYDFVMKNNSNDIKITKHLCWKILVCSIISSSQLKTFGDWEVEYSHYTGVISWTVHSCISDKLPPTEHYELESNGIDVGDNITAYQKFANINLDDNINYDVLRSKICFNYGLYVAIKYFIRNKSVKVFNIKHSANIISFHTRHNEIQHEDGSNSFETFGDINKDFDVISKVTNIDRDNILPRNAYSTPADEDLFISDTNILVNMIINKAHNKCLIHKRLIPNNGKLVITDLTTENGYNISIFVTGLAVNVVLNSYSMDMSCGDYILEKYNSCYECMLDGNFSNEVIFQMNKMVEYSKYVNYVCCEKIEYADKKEEREVS